MKNSENLYLALGTNLGDRARNLGEVNDRLRDIVAISRVSHIYQTPPWGVINQPDFLNQVVEAQSSLDPEELLKSVKAIEKVMGRVPSERYGPRLIDIDILIYGCWEFNSSDLIIPHPRMLERAFVLVPLAELAPDLTLPNDTETIQERLNTLDQTGITRWEKSHG